MSIQILPDIPFKADVRKKHENRISLQRFFKRRVQRRVHGQENRVRLKRNPRSSLSLASSSQHPQWHGEGRRKRSSSIYTPGGHLVHLENSGVTPFHDALGERNQFPKGKQSSASALGQLRIWWGRKIHKQTAPFFFFFKWRIIALQCCVGFRHTTTWINAKDTYISFLLSLLLTSPPSCSSRSSQSTKLSSLCCIAASL